MHASWRGPRQADSKLGLAKARANMRANSHNRRPTRTSRQMWSRSAGSRRPLRTRSHSTAGDLEMNSSVYISQLNSMRV